MSCTCVGRERGREQNGKKRVLSALPHQNVEGIAFEEIMIYTFNLKS